MKNTKKFLCTFLSAVMSLSALASCGDNGGNSGGSSDSGVEITPIVAYDGSDVDITFYHTMGANTLQPILNEYIPEFNRLYPNIHITHTMIGDYDALRSQISKELAGKNSPSLAYCYSDHVALYNKSKMVLTLDSYIASDAVVEHADGTTETMGYTQAQLDDFVESYWEEGRVYGDGKMYTLPFQKSSEVLFYNKTYFDAKGYTVPTTWDEMETLCQTIRSEESNCIPLGYDSESNWFITMCEQSGIPYTSATGDHYLFNTPEARAFVERFTNWHQSGYVTTKALNGNSYTSSLFTNIDSTKTRMYMCIGSTGGASNQIPDKVKNSEGEDVYPFEVGVAPIPQADVNNPKVISQGPSLVLFNKVRQAELNKTDKAAAEQEQAAAWLFAKFLTTCVELQAEFSHNNGYAPVVKSVQKNEFYSNWLAEADNAKNLTATAVIQALAQENACYISPAFAGSSEARVQVGLLMQTCFSKTDLGNMTLADFIKKAFDDTIDELEFNDL